jgi:hypothetical protein
MVEITSDIEINGAIDASETTFNGGKLILNSGGQWSTEGCTVTSADLTENGGGFITDNSGTYETYGNAYTASTSYTPDTNDKITVNSGVFEVGNEMDGLTCKGISIAKDTVVRAELNTTYYCSTYFAHSLGIYQTGDAWGEILLSAPSNIYVHFSDALAAEIIGNTSFANSTFERCRNESPEDYNELELDLGNTIDIRPQGSVLIDDSTSMKQQWIEEIPYEIRITFRTGTGPAADQADDIFFYAEELINLIKNQKVTGGSKSGYYNQFGLTVLSLSPLIRPDDMNTNNQLIVSIIAKLRVYKRT